MVHHSKALSKRRAQGELPLAPAPTGSHGICQTRVQRSGCGIIARWRPSAEHRPAIPAPTGILFLSVEFVCVRMFFFF